MKCILSLSYHIIYNFFIIFYCLKFNKYLEFITLYWYSNSKRNLKPLKVKLIERMVKTTTWISFYFLILILIAFPIDVRSFFSLSRIYYNINGYFFSITNRETLAHWDDIRVITVYGVGVKNWYYFADLYLPRWNIHVKRIYVRMMDIFVKSFSATDKNVHSCFNVKNNKI